MAKPGKKKKVNGGEKSDTDFVKVKLFQREKDDYIKVRFAQADENEYIRVMAHRGKVEITGVLAGIALSIITIFLVIYAAKQINIQRQTLDEIKNQMSLQTQSINEMKRDTRLTHKPVVFIKGAISPLNKKDAIDAKKHRFIITNSGRLPAKNLKLTLTFDDVYTSRYLRFTGGINVKEFTVYEGVNVYPEQEVTFSISDKINPFPIKKTGDWVKALITFSLSYEGEGLEGDFSEKQHLMFSEDTGYKWLLIGPKLAESVKRTKK